MSRLDELIRELCPDGVEYKAIQECTVPVSNIKWKLENTSHKYIDLTSVDRDTHRITDTLIVNKDNAPSRAQQIVKAGDILFGATRPMLKRYCLVGKEYDGDICSTGFCVLRANNCVVLTNWLYHQISSNRFYEHIERYQKGASYPAISDSEVKMYKIPVPPLPVQREIVRILDNFAELTAELTAKLTAELLAREKQYEYYRNLLFEQIEGEDFAISEIATTSIGLATSVTKHKREKGVILLHNSDIQQNAIVIKNAEFISEEFAKKNAKKILKENDIITVHTGDVGTSAVIKGEYIGAIGFTTITTRINDTKRVLPHYLCHYLNSHRCKSDIASMTISDRSNLNQSSYEKLTVPIPSIDEQRRIIQILDSFAMITSDISNCLPAEIEARRKQYEYYRDKLLTFRPLS